MESASYHLTAEPHLHAPVIFLHDRILAKTVLRLIPRRVTPNMVTWFRIAATPFVIWLILSGHYGWGVPVFLLVAFTDMIDGAMARTRDQITQLGTILDPLADKFLVGSMVIILVFRYLNPIIGWLVVILEILFILSAAFYRIAKGPIKGANWWGKLKMMLQVVAVFFVLMALLIDFPWLFVVASWIFGAAIAAAVASLFSHGI
ncbi:MAG: CDP-diacylglycerol--glycerol-3-phosphate 3-phosphatidyltransferase [Candidatus Magasanikbacteria bacterium]|nr:CDP-diacylglycerol--glycerol-3-phosphate 3-phosphatidyltransferase [Candidatus Magasanikbacteria bacterium]